MSETVYLTTEEENQRIRIEWLEELIDKAFERLQTGESIYPNSEAHYEFGVTIGKIKPKSTDWGVKVNNKLLELARKIVLCFPEKIPKGQNELKFNIPAYIIEELRNYIE